VVVILLEYLIASIHSGGRITVGELVKNVIPGGAVMAALGLLQGMLGFNEA
jgi:hypothetical protein